jgi:hypothetical protein
VNAAQSFFEREHCVFQPIAQENDFGKDAYVDLGDPDEISHLCVAVQIKSGPSYRTAGGEYAIPVQQHTGTWRRSTVPVFGIVYDPDDATLRWVDLTGHLRSHPDQDGGVVPVPRGAILSPAILRGEFTAAVARYENDGVPTARLLSSNERLQISAVWDAFALGRHDARHLIVLRRVLVDLQHRALREAIFALSHATPHPDILWIPTKNWIPPAIESEIQRTFRWTPGEIIRMSEVIEVEEWVRGGLGQCADMLLYQDPEVVPKLEDAVGAFITKGDLLLATRVATVAMSHARDSREELATLLERFPTLATDEWFVEVAAMVQEQGWLSLYA